MSLLCRLFGHRPAFGYHGEGQGYFKQRHYAVDGIGTIHHSLWCDCERCGTEFQVGMIHVDKMAHEDYANLKNLVKELKKEVSELERVKQIITQELANQLVLRIKAEEASQAQIDALMLEYCPDEMTESQKAEWARRQKPDDIDVN